MRRSVFFCLLIMILTSLCLFTGDVEAQTHQQKALAIVNDVVGLDISAYNVTSYKETPSSSMGLPTKDSNILFNSETRSLKVELSFVNYTLRRIYIFTDYTGNLSFNQPTTNVHSMAKGFLERYQNYTGNPFYGELRSILDNVTGKENVMKIVGNVKFEVLNMGNIVDYKWTYIDENGIIAERKNVLLSYERGVLKCFGDSWQFYTIGGKPKVSSEQALAIVLKALRNFSYNVGDGEIVSKFRIASSGDPIRTALSYLNYPDHSQARGGDQFTLYPSWYVAMGFDKFYPGGVPGAVARVWADTGKVSGIGIMGTYGTNVEEEEPDNIPPSITLTSPENKTYDTTDMFLIFNVSEPVSWVDYSLDGQANITVTGNTTTAGNVTLTELSEGSHSLTVYAADAYGSGANIGASTPIYFNVGQESGSQWSGFSPATLAIASAASVAIVSAGLLVYFRKRKHLS